VHTDEGGGSYHIGQCRFQDWEINIALFCEGEGQEEGSVVLGSQFEDIQRLRHIKLHAIARVMYHVARSGGGSEVGHDGSDERALQPGLKNNPVLPNGAAHNY